MSVRAKFYVTKLTISAHSQGALIELQPVVNQGSPENKTFWQYTPSGKLEMHVTNPDAANQFEVNKEFYLDFTPVEPAE